MSPSRSFEIPLSGLRKSAGRRSRRFFNSGQALVGIVHKELTEVIGGSDTPQQRELNLATQPPAVLLLAGLQGAGKTTTAGKTGRWLVKEKKGKY